MSGRAGAGVLAANPADFRAAALTLREVGRDTADLGEKLARGLALSSSGWTGLASLEQQARVEDLRSLLGLVPGPGEEAALLLERCALEAEDAAERVRAWGRALEEARATAARLRGSGPPPDPAGLAIWHRLLEEAEARGVRAAELIRQAEEEFDLTQRRVAAAAREAWAGVENGVSQIAALATLGQQGFSVKKKLGQAGLAAPGLVALALAGARGPLARAEAMVRAQDRLWAYRANQLKPGLANRVADALARLPGIPKLPPRLIPGGLGLLTVVDGTRDALDGGGYDGWRGGVTRVLGAAAVGAVPATFTPVPPVALAGAVTLGAYSAWTAGNWVYDNRASLADAGRAAVRVAGRAGRAAGSALQDGLRSAGQAGRALQRRVTGAAARVTFRTGQALDGALGRLRERGTRDLATLGGLAGELGEDLRRIGQDGSRIRLPDLPPLPRLPVELPSLPRLPVELPQPVLRAPWPVGATS